jgi:hypothetical protein
MGDFNFDLQNKNLGFQNLWSTHSVVSKLCLKSQENINLCLPCEVLPGEQLQAL